MKRRVRVVVFMLVVIALVALSAAPAFAACLNPSGAHTGWEACGSCCERPRGNAYGWEPCNACCDNPRGQIAGWVACD